MEPDFSMTASDCASDVLLLGQRVALAGKLAGMPKREAQQLLRRHGAAVVAADDPSATLLVIGEQELPLGDSPEDAWNDAAREAVDRGTLEVIGEAQLWQRLGLVDRHENVHRLYTPSMLSQLLGVSVPTI